MQYLLEGARQGEPVLYVTLAETQEELGAVAASHGWSLEGVAVHQSVPSEDSLRPEEQYTVFHPSEVELTDTTTTILTEVSRIKPRRLVLDSLSELRLLAGNPLRYRRQILALKQFFAGSGCTVLLLDDLTASDRDLQVQSIAHGVLSLEQLQPDYGAERRRLRVLKYRGVRFHGGYHDFAIRHGGLDVFQRLVTADSPGNKLGERLSSGIVGLDELLGGGIERGTSTLITGAAGSGKSSIAAHFVTAAADRGLRGAMFIFDESRHMLLSRCAGLGMNLDAHVESGRVAVRQLDPAELSPGEFAHTVCRTATAENFGIVVIDSLNGFLNAMPDERFLIIHLHELLTYLSQHGVATILIGVQHGLIGSSMVSPVETSYLADAVILLRYFEAGGEVRQALSVIKKRGGEHERTIRELRLEQGGIRVGQPLREFHGVLTGVPVYAGSSDELMGRRSR
jgi:circadian clock protein KaiC